MDYITLSCVIAAKDPAAEPREAPCSVQQQQDTEDTVPCSGDQALLAELLRFMGFDIPVPELPDAYSAQIKVQPKNPYTNLNIDFSGNVEASAGRLEQSEDQQSVSISSSDFVVSGAEGYVDLAGKLNLVETDKIKSASWIGTVYDAELVALASKPPISIDDDNRLPLAQPVNAELMVTVEGTSQVFDVTVSPRAGATENAYQSSIIIQPEGCEGRPTRFEIEVPDCYQHRLYDNVGWPGAGVDVEIIDPPPEFVEPSDVDREWCVCGYHRLRRVSPKSAEPDDISNVCYSGPCDQITEPDCVPDDREEGDDYC